MILKRLFLAGISFAIIVSCYMLYSLLVTTPEEEAFQEKITTVPATLPVIKSSTTRPMAVKLSSPEDAVLASEGDNPYFETYSHGQLIYQFRAAHWKPSDPNKAGKIDLLKPEIRIFLRGGQILHISSSEGEIEGVRTRQTPLDPKRGKLTGKVHILIDRGTDPNRPAPEKRPGDITNIYLDWVYFDLERSRIESASALKVMSEETELIGQSLTITWNDLTKQIENIIVQKGEKLVLKQGTDMFRMNVPLGEGTKKGASANQAGFFGHSATQASPAGSLMMNRYLFSPSAVVKSKFTAQVKPTTSPSTQTSQPDEPVIAGSKHSSTQPRGSKAYDLEFTSNVRIIQYDNSTVTGEMTCDRLNVIFDLPSSSETKNLTTKPAGEKRIKSVSGQRFEITWDGPLQLKPKILPWSKKRRFHIVASGRQVLIDQLGQGSIRCKKLTYKDESKQVELDGTVDEPVNISEGGNRTLVAAHLMYDREKRIAAGKGPGFMKQSAKGSQASTQSVLSQFGDSGSKSQTMTATWNDGFLLQFGEYDVDAFGENVRQYLKKAEFYGSARLERPDEIMSGDLLHLGFVRPFGEGKNSQQIDKLHAEKNVLLQSGRQKITCQYLDVDFAPGITMERIPKLANAKGHVVVRDGDRVIAADDLTAVMDEESEILPTNQPSSTRPATSKNRNRFLRDIQAKGNVMIRDPGQEMQVNSTALKAKFDTKGQISWCELEGTDTDWAIAVSKDNILAGKTIFMNVADENVKIPCAGSLKFVNNQDLVGSQKSSTVPIVIHWKDSMQIFGKSKNQGTFAGDIRVESGNTTVYCSRMLIDFTDIPQQVSIPETLPENRFWVFSKLLKSRGAKEDIKLPIARKRPSYIQAFPETNKTITVQYLDYEGGKLINRTSLFGAELTLDLRTQRLNMPGPGNLFIENFGSEKQKKSKPSPEVSSADQNPFDMAPDTSGFSQTVFDWKTGLVYLLDVREAIFDGKVSMKMISYAQKPPVTQASTLPASAPKRFARLTCENLKVEFVRGAFGAIPSDSASKARMDELKTVVASGMVFLEEKPFSILAQRLIFNRSDNLIAVFGTETEPAQLSEEKQESGEMMLYEGPKIIWDRAHDKIVAPNAKIISNTQNGQF
jgi:hypothetical protein